LSWQRLVALASRGELDPDAMLIKENSDRWVRAGTLRALFVGAPSANIVETPAMGVAPSPQPDPQRPTVRTSRAAAPSRPGVTEAQNLESLLAYIQSLDATLKPVATLAQSPAAPAPAAVSDIGSIDTLKTPAETMASRLGMPSEAKSAVAAEPEEIPVMAPSLPVLNSIERYQTVDSPAEALLGFFGVQTNTISAIATAFPITAPLTTAPPFESAPQADVDSNAALPSVDAPCSDLATVQETAAEPTVAPRKPALASVAAQPTAPAERGFFEKPWVMEGLVAATISILLAASIALGFNVFDGMQSHEQRPASPEQHVANHAPDGNR
jgi:hypothetical protein